MDKWMEGSIDKQRYNKETGCWGLLGICSLPEYLEEKSELKEKDVYQILIHCDVRLESWNLRIRRAQLREARSRGNTK
jgi:hypothetical protein